MVCSGGGENVRSVEMLTGAQLVDPRRLSTSEQSALGLGIAGPARPAHRRAARPADSHLWNQKLGAWRPMYTPEYFIAL